MYPRVYCVGVSLSGMGSILIKRQWRSFFLVPFAIVYSVGDVISSYYFNQ